jgi:hypothetical protein
MMESPLGSPQNVTDLLARLRADHAQPRVYLLGNISDGVNHILRFMPGPSTFWVTVRVQTDPVYEGGTIVSAVIVDCRTTRIQTVTVPADGHYYVWFVPLAKDGVGNWITYDGTGGPDMMSFIELGA